ncbi:DUF1758 domain-containing protein [Trichonephila clavata]|uniref:DUF1758 domain-containing protein n=1 Tax=Trichonephila clavata TaxID=2740835 RepID=A0A8X6FNT3_TRICU|nr:DUF1758 domain-containing protein [Trichonephila clavata]
MTNLRHLVDTSDEVLRGLKALGTEANRDPWLIQILMQKLDAETKRLQKFFYISEGSSFLFRALMDSGSESSFISENAINILGLKRCTDKLSLSGISGIQAGTTRGSGISLADEDFSRPSECDVILGSDCFSSILRNGRIIGSKGQPIAQSTIFGWVVAGKIQGNCKSPFRQSHLIRVENESNIDSILQQFSQTEELSIKKLSLSKEEFCENPFKGTFKINNEGRFGIKLLYL